MDCSKVGSLLLSLRQERGWTQKQLADVLNLSDRTISKWERGLGCPDVSLLPELSAVLAVDIEKILLGDLQPNDEEVGNMKKLKFYVCPQCGSAMFAMGEAEISCCGRPLQPLAAQEVDEEHALNVAEVEEDYYLTWQHEMSKQHYLAFVAYVTYDRVLFIKLYPEQAPEVRFPRQQHGEIYFYCSQHGLMKQRIARPDKPRKVRLPEV